MQIRSIPLPKVEMFPCSSKDLKLIFADIEPLRIWRGALQKRFSFDSRCSNRPKLKGKVVASVSVNRNLTAIMQVYPVRRTNYSPEALIEFRETMLPFMHEWLIAQLSKQPTAILGVEKLIIEWTGTVHKTHTVRFL